jgi:hypothetical protein
MKTNFIVLAAATLMTFIVSGQVSACPGAAIAINDDTTITADGIIGGTAKFNVSHLQEMILRGQTASFVFTDKRKQSTHRVEYLGSVSDEGGVVQSSYFVRDLRTGAEKTYMLYSNYQGGGITAKGLETPESTAKKDDRFNSLFTAGCK